MRYKYIDISQVFLGLGENLIKVGECKFCGTFSGKYELCQECHNLAKNEIIIKNEKGEWIKNEKGEWIKNIRKGNEYK